MNTNHGVPFRNENPKIRGHLSIHDLGLQAVSNNKPTTRRIEVQNGAIVDYEACRTPSLYHVIRAASTVFR